MQIEGVYHVCPVDHPHDHATWKIKHLLLKQEHHLNQTFMNLSSSLSFFMGVPSLKLTNKRV